MAIGSTARIAALLATAAGLSGCTIYDGYGTGYNSGYYADSAYPDECYDKDGYLYPECEDATYVARNGYGYGGSWYNNYGPYGWYDGFYYPGYSVYIFDRQGHRHRWSDNHRRHWEGRRHARRDGDGRRGDGRQGDGRRGDGHRGDGTTANRDQRRDGRRGDRGRDGERRAVAPDDNPRGVRGQMRGFRGDGPGPSGTNANTGRQASPPAPAAAAAPPPPPPPPARTNRDRENSPTTRQTQRVRQNPSRNDPQ